MDRRAPHFDQVVLSLVALLVVAISHTAQAAPAATTNLNGTQSVEPISVESRIVGGTNAQPGQFPWQVAIVQDNSFFCGGSIIAPQWILTAGHCTYKVLVYAVTVGTLYSGAAPSGVKEPNRKTILTNIGIPHPLYFSNPFQDNNDVGLIRLPRSLEFSANVKAVPLATLTPEYLNLDMDTATVSGWGKTSDLGTVSSILKWTDLSIVPGNTCTVAYGDLRMDQKICCSTLDGKSTCNGDSGGPLVKRGSDTAYHQIGIVSYGSTSCTARIPVVFTRVTAYLNFIEGTAGLATQASSSG